MIFNSFIFWVFFAAVLLLYWRLPLRGQNQLLLVASYVFYGYWDWRFLGLLAASTIVDYLRRLLPGAHRRRAQTQAAASPSRS